MSNNLVHLTMDLETLGMREDTVILSLACVPFTFEEHDYFSNYVKNGIMIKFNVEEQIKKYHRSIDKETVEWWKKQEEQTRKMNLIPSPTDYSLINGLTTLSKFIGNSGYNFKESYVFSRGNYFDFPKLEHVYEVSARMKQPINTYKIRDVRTYLDIFAGVSNGQYECKLGDNKSFIKHNCLHDAAMDSARMNELYYIALKDPPF